MTEAGGDGPVAGGDGPEDGPAYVRGGGIAIDRRRATQIIAGFCIVTLVVLIAVLGGQAASSNSRYHRLHSRGVAVDATVTTCVGVASGTGITTIGYQCDATFSLDGRTHTDALAGTSALYATGQVVHAVVDPQRPSDLSVTAAVTGAHRDWPAYVPAAICLLALLIGLGFLRWLSVRARRT